MRAEDFNLIRGDETMLRALATVRGDRGELRTHLILAAGVCLGRGAFCASAACLVAAETLGLLNYPAEALR